MFKVDNKDTRLTPMAVDDLVIEIMLARLKPY